MAAKIRIFEVLWFCV